MADRLDPIVLAMWEEELKNCSCLSCHFLREDKRQAKHELWMALTQPIETSSDAQ